MGKRGAPSTTTASSKRTKGAKGKSSDELNEMVEKEREAIESLPWWGSVMDDVDKIMADFGSVSEFLMKTYPDVGARKDFSEKLAMAFPTPTGQKLSKDFDGGIKNFSLWQVCYHVQAGNKGLVISEYMKNLVSLVLLQGCKTDASTMPGVEYPVTQELCLEYFEEKWELEQLQPAGADSYPCQSIAFTKGWTRGCAFVFAGFLIMKHNLVDFYKDKLPRQYASFCMLKGLAPETYKSEGDRIQANRGYLVERLVTYTLTLLVDWILTSLLGFYFGTRLGFCFEFVPQNCP